eukprot:1682587-Prymnesium_polylepis.1
MRHVRRALYHNALSIKGSERLARPSAAKAILSARAPDCSHANATDALLGPRPARANTSREPEGLQRGEGSGEVDIEGVVAHLANEQPRIVALATHVCELHIFARCKRCSPVEVELIHFRLSVPLGFTILHHGQVAIREGLLPILVARRLAGCEVILEADVVVSRLIGGVPKHINRGHDHLEGSRVARTEMLNHVDVHKLFLSRHQQGWHARGLTMGAAGRSGLAGRVPAFLSHPHPRTRTTRTWSHRGWSATSQPDSPPPDLRRSNSRRPRQSSNPLNSN